MFSSNPVKFLLIPILVLSLFLSCRTRQNVGDKSVLLNGETRTQTATPFSNKEPKIFQTKIFVTMNLDGKTSTKKFFAARNGAKTLATFNIDEGNETSLLETGNGKTYVLKKKEKTYVEKIYTGANPKQGELNRFLTTEWLNEKRNVKFEKIDSKNKFTIYRVNFEDAKDSEILIYIDENLHIPIKQEFFETKSDKRTLVFTVELKDFKPATDDQMFKIPKDYSPETTQ